MTRNASFAGVAFDVEEAGPLARRDYGRKAILSERLSVGGGRRIRQLLGYEAPALTLTLELDKADLAALRAKVGTLGSLAVEGAATLSGWLLAAIPDESVTVDDMHGLVFCTATFEGP